MYCSTNYFITWIYENIILLQRIISTIYIFNALLSTQGLRDKSGRGNCNDPIIEILV